MSNLLVSEVGFAGTTKTHLLVGEWSYVNTGLNRTVCGLKATAVGYYQIGMSEVHCLNCIRIHGGK